jgi:ATP-dependent RNA helicase RhlE
VVPGFEPQQLAPAAPVAPDGQPIDTATGGIKGKRPSKKDKLRALVTAAK